MQTDTENQICSDGLDVVLFDYDMPGYDGRKTLEFIQGKQELKRILQSLRKMTCNIFLRNFWNLFSDFLIIFIRGKGHRCGHQKEREDII